MARLDAYIELLFREPGSQLVFESGAPALLRIAGEGRPVIRQPLSTAQIVGACTELVPDELRGRFTGAVATQFTYEAPSGLVAIEFQPKEGKVRAVVTAADHAMPVTPPPAPTMKTPPSAARAPTPGPAAAPATNGASHGTNGAAAPERRIVIEAGAEGPAASMALLLSLMIKQGASDLHLSSGASPCLRLDGDIVPLTDLPVLTPERLTEMLWSITPEKYQKQWSETHDTDFAHETEEARFRVNVFADRKGIGAVLRQIPAKLRTAEEMGLPQALLDLCGLKKGLVLVTGPTGSGKSTTLAAMIDYINRNRDDHILTIEDPIEFVHDNKKCLINQREVGVHTAGFKTALRAALREDPDIVLVGELRDLETIAIAIETAETGHLVFGTLHTNTAPSTVDRIIDQFPADRQSQIRTMLSESLRGVVSQQLCKKEGGGRAAALEILLCSGAVSNLIREGKTFQIASVMQTGRGAGMQTMNDALLELVKKKLVSPREAYSRSIQKSELKGSLERAGFKVEDPADTAGHGAPAAGAPPAAR